MSYYRNTTQVTNALFDIYLKTLSEKELKVLLIVIRQTVGWVEKNGKRKERDWISRTYFKNKTGLSEKSISTAIDLLVKRNFIRCSTTNGTTLRTAKERKGKSRIYYQCSHELLNNHPLG